MRLVFLLMNEMKAHFHTGAHEHLGKEKEVRQERKA